MIIGRRAEHIRAIERRHRLLLFRANHEHGIVKTAHDPLRAEKHGERTGSARGFGMHRRDAMKCRVNFRDECAEMQLFGELASVEVSHRRRFDLRRFDLRVGNRVAARFRDQIADGLAFLFQVALKVSSAAAEDVDWFFHTMVLIKLNARACHQPYGTRRSNTPRPGLQTYLRGSVALSVG